MSNDNTTTSTEAQTPQGEPQDSQGQPNGTDPAPTPTGGENGPQNGAQGSGGEDVSSLPEWAQTLIRKANADAADARTSKTSAEKTAQDRVTAILTAAGIDTGEGEDDPVKAAADARETAENDARQARLELAVYKSAPTANADPAALLDSRAFLARAADLDPSDQEAVAGAIRDAIKDNPKLAATQAAPRNSADFTGASGDGAITPEKFRDMDMGQRNELFRADPDTYRRLAATTK